MYDFFPIYHSFKYPLFYFGLDLDNISSLAKANGPDQDNSLLAFLQSFLYSYNGFALFSLRADDYLFGSLIQHCGSTIKDQLGLYLKRELGYCPTFSKIELITTPRVLGYSFNPVSFYFCYIKNEAIGEDFDLAYVVYEVHNTFGERHIYILSPEKSNQTESIILNRSFHVSPFNDRTGTYSTTLIDPRTSGKLEVAITLMEKHKRKLTANVRGVAQPASPINLISCFVKYPLNAFLSMPRILYQAYILHYAKKLKVYQRPAPMKPILLNLSASIPERYSFVLFKRFIDELALFSGMDIILEEPSCTSHVSLPEVPSEVRPARISLSLYSYELCSMLVWQMKGDSFLFIWAITYMTGEWSCSHLSVLLECILRFHCKQDASCANGAFLYAAKRLKALFLNSEWRKNASLAQPFKDSFVTYTTLGTQNEGLYESTGFYRPDSLNREGTDANFFILALPLQDGGSQSYMDSSFDILAATSVSEQSSGLELLFNCAIHLVLLCWALFSRFLELFFFRKVATFQYLGDPNLKAERFYANLAFVLKTTASPEDEPNFPILNFGFYSQAKLSQSPGKSLKTST
ncbi:hypothetical protein DSO57_1022480 [Entomophthora muscae]|uniref:Uncharacterized protein n=1 Tax=Entomophthora muscae TaxID=34485 RepID=A0ACC2TEI0_9FUNG|nr:hypothetical protein DSO57_1022480 [Entomophthora muscae]